MDMSIADLLTGLGASLPTILMIYIWQSEKADHKATREALDKLTHKVLVKAGVIGD